MATRPRRHVCHVPRLAPVVQRRRMRDAGSSPFDLRGMQLNETNEIDNAVASDLGWRSARLRCGIRFGCRQSPNRRPGDRRRPGVDDRYLGWAGRPRRTRRELDRAESRFHTSRGAHDRRRHDRHGGAHRHRGRRRHAAAAPAAVGSGLQAAHARAATDGSDRARRQYGGVQGPRRRRNSRTALYARWPRSASSTAPVRHSICH